MQQTLDATSSAQFYHYNLAQAKAVKRKEAAQRSNDREMKKGKTKGCKATQRYTLFSLATVLQKELQDECFAHGLPMAPPNPAAPPLGRA